MTDSDVTQRWQSAEVAETYEDERFTSLAGRFFHWSQCRALRRFLRQVGRIDVLADVPVGTGRLLPVLLASQRQVLAFDVSDAMMAQAKARMNGAAGIRFTKADARHLPLADQSVDAVTSIRFFMHLTEEQRAEILRELRRVTRRWVLVEYGCDNRWHRVRRMLRRLILRALGVLRTEVRQQPRRQILLEARQAGLDVRRWFWTARGLSESVLVLMERSDSAKAGNTA